MRLRMARGKKVSGDGQEQWVSTMRLGIAREGMPRGWPSTVSGGDKDALRGEGQSAGCFGSRAASARSGDRMHAVAGTPRAVELPP
jgi:hypothetical protein